MKIFKIVCYRMLLVLTALPITFISPLNAAETQGGFIESSTTTEARSVLSRNQILGFLPNRGEFTFPAPYGTEGVRLTNDNDCSGQDCVNYAGYAYWRNINNHEGMDSLLVFIGLDKNQGGPGPSLFEYNKNTGAVTQRGPLFDDNHSMSWATGEGWYFSATLPTTMYVNDGYRLQRLDVISGELETVMDVREIAGPDFYMSQLHSSDDDTVHSATMRDGNSYQALGCMTYNESNANFQFFPSEGGFDECQVDRSGNWLVIKEDVDGINGEDNRIINLDSLQERQILDSQGAAGHSDLGHGYMIAADNWASEANTWKLWDFQDSNLSGQIVYHNQDWGVFAPAHVSHTNSRSNMAPEQQYVCGSSVNSNNSAHANEIICFGLDSSMDTLVVAPSMTDLNAAGGGNEYAQLPKGNLDVTGQYFFWTSNTGGNRLDAFLVKVPDYLSSGESAPTQDNSPAPIEEEEPANEPDVTDTDTGSETPVNDPVPVLSANAVLWENLVNASVAGGRLSKSAGCDGCADSRATSVQQITEGNGSVEFTVTDANNLIYVGLKPQGSTSTPSAIDFAIRLQSGSAEVRENDIYRSDTAFAAGDKFRIAIVGDTVQYAKNGNVFYTSSNVEPWYPLHAQAILLSLNSTVDNSTFSVPAAEDNSPTPTEEEPANEPDVTDTDTGSETPVNDPETVLSPSAVQWENLVNTSVAGGRLSKTAGCDGCGDASATSVQQIMEGNGSLEFTATDANNLIYVGLKPQGSTSTPGAIAFAIRLQSGSAEVRENDIYRSDTAFAAGDKFRIAIVGNTVQYAKNGNVFYTSNAQAGYPLHAQAILLSMNSTVDDSTITVAVAGSTSNDTEGDSGTVDTDTGSSSVPGNTDAQENPTTSHQALQVTATSELPADAVVWSHNSNVTMDGMRLSKTSGCDGCPDARATSVQKIKQGDGSLQFTVTDTNDLIYVGLKQISAQIGTDAIDFAIRLQSGSAEVRERDVYKTDISFSAGDIFRISIVANKVKYAKNGTVFYTSDAEPVYPLNAETILHSANSAIEDYTFVAESAPQISGLQVGMLSANSVMLRWTSDVPAQNMAQYGTNGYESHTPLVRELSTQHSVTLTNLSAGSTYHFRVLNRGADGHITISSDQVFNMPAQ